MKQSHCTMFVNVSFEIQFANATKKDSVGKGQSHTHREESPAPTALYHHILVVLEHHPL